MFAGIPGQERAKAFFARALHDGSLSHAYLLAGPAGLAKTAFARELGAGLVTPCGGCGACPDCARARNGVHPDLHVLEREGDLIRVEQIEPVVADLSLRPFSAAYRIWVISEVEYLHPAAANKLLKSIEEPPSPWCSSSSPTELERVLPTIVSRCQHGRVPAAQRHRGVRLSHGAPRSRRADRRSARPAVARLRRTRRCGWPTTRRARPPRSTCDTWRCSQPARARPMARIRARLSSASSSASRRRSPPRSRQTWRGGAPIWSSQFQDKKDLAWYVEQAEGRAKRETARLRRLAAQDALDLLVSWVRDLWVVASGASDVLWNCDRRDRIVEAAVATPEHYVRLLGVAAKTRQDLYLNIDQKLALQAMLARFEEVSASA